MERLGHALGIGNGIADSIIDSRETGGMQVAKPRHLHRRRPACKHTNPLVPGVARQVHQDVDPVLEDRPGDGRIELLAQVPPAVGSRDRVRARSADRTAAA